MKFILILIFAINVSFAYVPTIESLFRNSENKDIDQNTVVVSFKIKPILNNSESIEDIYVKYYFYTESGKTKLLKLIFNNNQMVLSELAYIFYVTDFESFYSPKVQMNKGTLLHSIFLSLSLNKTENIMKYLKHCSPEIKTNRESINKEKVYLYERYRNYLMTIRDEPSLKQTLTNPLEGSEGEEREKVKNTLNSPYYAQSSFISLDKKGDEFYLKFESPNVKALFTNEDHRLKEISAECSSSNQKLLMTEYLLFNGVHELPKHWYLKDGDLEYHIQILDVTHMTLSAQKLAERITSYNEAIAKNAKSVQVPEIIK